MQISGYHLISDEKYVDHNDDHTQYAGDDFVSDSVRKFTHNECA